MVSNLDILTWLAESIKEDLPRAAIEEEYGNACDPSKYSADIRVCGTVLEVTITSWEGYYPSHVDYRTYTLVEALDLLARNEDR